ncbi:metallophosphoesterase family protein [Enterococcus sp. HY326]|uniref:metallophosphoesterase family protein n=1 Tax=Enterococcus sp. HY326 TaxID=2971265 RepID=UPI00223FB960|nr:DNA repair exonuclease [Enterococcus sp. HY326]
MRLLHIADFHFDRAFEGLPQNQGIDFTNLEGINQQVWQNTLDIALKRQVDAVILAGDTFHQVQSSLKMQRLFFDGLQQLAQAKIQIVVIFGNHDYYQENKFWFHFPEEAIVFTEEKVSTKIIPLANGETVAFSGFSFTKPWIVEEKALEFPLRERVDYHIGIYHGEIGNKNRYAPFQVGQLAEKGYDYWALGHIHKGQQVFERGYYAGTPQGHNQKENSGTGVLLVDIKGSNLSVEAVSVAEVDWQAQPISLKDLKEIGQLGATFVGKIKAALATQRQTFLRLSLQDYDQLGNEFIKRVQSGEALSLLNQQLQQVHEPIVVTEINLESVASESGLPISEELLNQGLALYQDQEIFNNALKDLTANPDLRGILADDFQEQVLRATQKLIKLQE